MRSLAHIVNKHFRLLAFAGALGTASTYAGCEFELSKPCTPEVCVGGDGDAGYSSRGSEAGAPAFGVNADKHDARVSDDVGFSDDAGVPDVPPPNPDRDDDGVLNEVDNCPGTPNPLQSDVDRDGSGDECDDEIGCVEGLLFRDSHMDLFLHHFDDGRTQQLTEEDNVHFVSWNPDGRGFAYTTSYSVNVKQFGTASRKLFDVPRIDDLPQGFVNTPAWSPDGEWIAYTYYAPHPLAPFNAHIYKIRPDGTQNQCGTCNLPANYSSPDWMPDGTLVAQRLILVQDSGDNERLFVHSDGIVLIKEGMETKITADNGVGYSDPAWWGADTLAFTEQTKMGVCRDVLRTPCGSRGSTFFFSAHPDSVSVLYHPTWSPNGDSIIYALSRPRGDGRETRIVRLDNVLRGDVSRRELFEGFNPAWSPGCNQRE